MPSIYRPPGCKKYRIAYVNERGQRVNVPGFRDKQATLEKARKLERDAERARAGLPIADQQRRQQPITELMELWIAELERLGRSHAHIQSQRRLLGKLWSACSWNCLAQLKVDDLDAFLTTLRYSGRGARALNSYRDALHAFLRFCQRRRWIEDNPLRDHPKAREPGGKKRRPRRAYTVDEFQALVATATRHKTLYLVAGLSGLRRSELRQLEKRDLTPTGPHPTWHLRAEIAKGRRKDVVPMLPDVVGIIRPLWEAAPNPTDRIFASIPRTKTLNRDQQESGVVHTDAEGRTVDFHSFRYFFCTLCAKHMPIQMVRLLMRHRDIRQTCNLYMDLGLTDIQEAMTQLPKALPEPKEKNADGPPGNAGANGALQ